MRGLEIAQPAVLHEWDPASGELELQQVAVVGGAHEDSLLAELHLPLSGLEYAVADFGGLGCLVAAERELGTAALTPVAPKLLGEGAEAWVASEFAVSRIACEER